VLHYNTLERFAAYKRSSLLDPFISYLPEGTTGKVGISVLCGVTGIDWLPPEAAAATAAPAASTAAAAAVEEVNGMIPEKTVRYWDSFFIKFVFF
jgi:hypothetical protein